MWVASGSGGHINPAVSNNLLYDTLSGLTLQQVTLTLAVFRKFSWKKVPIYVVSQTLGAWAGAMLVYITYYTALGIVDPMKTSATASLFSTYALEYVPSGESWGGKVYLSPLTA